MLGTWNLCSYIALPVSASLTCPRIHSLPQAPHPSSTSDFYCLLPQQGLGCRPVPLVLSRRVMAVATYEDLYVPSEDP